MWSAHCTLMVLRLACPLGPGFNPSTDFYYFNFINCYRFYLEFEFITRLESSGPSYCWNELITLSTKYRDLTGHSQLALTVCVIGFAWYCRSNLVFLVVFGVVEVCVYMCSI